MTSPSTIPGKLIFSDATSFDSLNSFTTLPISLIASFTTPEYCSFNPFTSIFSHVGITCVLTAIFSQMIPNRLGVSIFSSRLYLAVPSKSKFIRLSSFITWSFFIDNER